MNPRERVRAALAHEETDRPPWGEIVIDDQVVADFLGCGQVAWEQRREFASRVGLDIICLAPGFPAWQADGELSLPEPGQADWGDLPQWAGRTRRYLFVMLDAGLGWATRCLGWQKAIMQTARSGGKLAGFFRAVEEMNLELAARARDLGASGLLLAEDIAYQQGLIMSPDQFRALLLPSLERQVTGFKALGLTVFFHSDGNLNQVLDDLAGIGLHGWQCLESGAGMDLAQIKQRHGRKLTLWGNLDPACLLLPDQEDAIIPQVRACVRDGGSGGGFIMGTSSGLMPGVRPQALKRIQEALRAAPE